MEPPENQSKQLFTAVFHPISENKKIICTECSY